MAVIVGLMRFLKSRLAWLLIFAFAAFWLLMRLQVEWLWFAQFDLQSMLLRRWLWQLGGLLISLFAIAACYFWQRHWINPKNHQDINEPFMRLIGWRYGLVLICCLVLVVGDLVLLSRLAWLASFKPFVLGYWWAEPFEGLWAVVIPLSTVLITTSLMLGTVKVGRFAQIAGSACFSISVARGWGLWSLALAIPPTGIREPLLGADVSFGLGRYPALSVGLTLLLLQLVLTVSTSFFIQLSKPEILSDWLYPGLTSKQSNLLRPIISLILLNLAAINWLSRHQLLWTENGTFAGAGWLDVHLIIPLRNCSSVGLLLLALLLIPTSGIYRLRLWRVAVATFAIISALLEILVAPVVQWMVVKPRELELEKPYLINGINATRRAFQLDSITTTQINPQPYLTLSDLEEGASTLRNIRLWDSQPLLATNRQLQQLRSYYRFSNAAVDRYNLLPGSMNRQQVMITARELDQTALPKRSRTWLNRHFVFTHGYGFTLSPVNTKAVDGLPEYFISDIGRATRVEGSKQLEISKEDVMRSVPIGRAALYFGMLPSPYALAPTKVKELDYPEGDNNSYNHYSGSGGVPLKTIWQRIAAAVYLYEPRLLNNVSLTNKSRLLIRREVRQRLLAIAPFIEVTDDPYLVSISIEKGDSGYNPSQNQYWIVEGYTSSRSYPYAASLHNDRPVRYLRNSIKATVDAYSGRVQLYISEPQDPIILGWQRLFPDLFKPLDDMPSGLREHLKVPTDLFDAQVQQLLRYHVTDPTIFYSGDDVWQVPMELYGRQQVPVIPYHTTAQLRASEGLEFLLLQPLTPLARPNLSAWLAARSDGSNYGKLVLLRFPSQTPIFGPEQIQALINQDPEISQQFGLWDRAGSEVVQGNLLVVPLGNALLYVEPVYLRARQGGLPTLTRIVVSDGKRIAMAENLLDGLRALVKDSNAR